MSKLPLLSQHFFNVDQDSTCDGNSPLCVRARVRACAFEKERVSVCVCVCARARERERERDDLLSNWWVCGGHALNHRATMQSFSIHYERDLLRPCKLRQQQQHRTALLLPLRTLFFLSAIHHPLKELRRRNFSEKHQQQTRKEFPS